MARCAELGMPAMALPDRNGLYGAARFHTAAKRSGVAGAHWRGDCRFVLGKRLRLRRGCRISARPSPSRITLLCASQTGYQNLCQLITRFKMREATKAEGAATLDDLEEFSAGLDLPDRRRRRTAGRSARAAADEEAARKTLDRLAAIYGRGNVYVELQRHRDREEECRNQSLLSTSPLAAVCRSSPPTACATPRKKIAKLLDVFTAIRHHTHARPRGPPAHCQRRAPPALRARDDGALSRSSRSHRQHAHRQPRGWNSRSTISATSFPHYPVPDGETMDSFLEKRVEEGVRKRYGSPSQAASARQGARSRCSTNSRSSPSSASPDTSSSSGTSSATASGRAFWCRAAARRPTPPSATR